MCKKVGSECKIFGRFYEIKVTMVNVPIYCKIPNIGPGFISREKSFSVGVCIFERAYIWVGLKVR